MNFASEEEKLRKAEATARELAKKLSPETIAKVGEENIVSDLIHEILMGMPESPSE